MGAADLGNSERWHLPVEVTSMRAWSPCAPRESAELLLDLHFSRLVLFEVI